MPGLDDGTALVQRQTLATQLYDVLERKILSGQLAPGTRLSEEAVAAACGVSRSPAREALAELERVGLATRLGFRDRMVAVPSREMILQKYDLWWILEVGRTYLGAVEATPHDHEELRRLLDRMAETARAGDAGGHNQASQEFHDALRKGCRNPDINRRCDDCDLYLRWFETLYYSCADLSEQAIDEHRRIVEAYIARDLATLSEAIRDHILRQRERLIELFLQRRSDAS